MAKDKDVRVRLAAAWALWKIDNQVAVAREIFNAAKDDKNEAVRSEARRGLERIKAESTPGKNTE